MSPRLDRTPVRAVDVVAEAHEKARMLASDAIDAALAPADAAWLAEHLSGCADCQLVADEYRAMHDELRGLDLPEPPRDLWARTSAALDSVDRTNARRARRPGFGSLGLGGFARTRSSMGSVMAVAVAVVVVGLSLLSQGPLFIPAAAPSRTATVAVVSAAPSGGPQAALAMVDGNSYWVAPDDGVYQIKGGTAHCTGSPESCAVTSGKGTVLGSVTSKSAVSVAISSNATQAAVWTSDKIIILPLTQSAPATVAIDLLTPRPPAVATTAPRTTPTPTRTPASTMPPASTGSATTAPTPTARLTAPVASVGPSSAASATAQPTQSAAPATPAPSGATSAAVAQPTAILDGYKIVGGAPQFSADGLWVAFSARPSNLNSGSDVFVWRVGWGRALAVTTSHSDLFAGWFGTLILISEFSSEPGTSATPAPTAAATAVPATAAPSAATVSAIAYLYDPSTAAVRRIDRSMLMPVVDPMGRYVVYWAGSVAYNPATGLYGPGKGAFYFDAWSNVHLVTADFGGDGGAAPSPQPSVVPSATSTAVPSIAPTGPVKPGSSSDPVAAPDQSTSGRVSPTQGSQPTSEPDNSTGLPQRVLAASAPGTVAAWSVRWDATGQYVAIWVASAAATDAGHVTLLNVIPGTNMLNVDGLLLSAPARSNIQFDDSQFVYTSPAQGGDAKTYLFQLPAVPPTPIATPEITAPPASSGSGKPAASEQSPVSTDRPGS